MLQFGEGFGYSEIPAIVKFLENIYNFQLKNIVLNVFFVHGESFLNSQEWGGAIRGAVGSPSRDIIINGARLGWSDFRHVIVHEFVHAYHQQWFSERGNVEQLLRMEGNHRAINNWYFEGQAEYLSYLFPYPQNTHNRLPFFVYNSRETILNMAWVRALGIGRRGDVVPPTIRDVRYFYRIDGISGRNYGVFYALTWYLVRLYGLETLNNYVVALSNAPAFRYKTYGEIVQSDRNAIALRYFGKTEEALLDGWLEYFDYFGNALTVPFPPSQPAFALESLTPTFVTTTTAPRQQSFILRGLGFDDVVEIEMTWQGHHSGQQRWSVDDPQWRAGVTLVGVQQLGLTIQVVEQGANWVGTTDWAITLRDRLGRTVTRFFVVRFLPPAPLPDREGPNVRITSGPVSASTLYVLRGVVSDNVGVVRVLLNGNPIGFTPSLGSFEHQLQLREGPNSLTVAAEDAAGNTGQASITVLYNPPPRDTVAPNIVVAAPDRVASPRVDVSVTVTDDVEVDYIAINGGMRTFARGRTVQLAERIILNEGDNIVTITARDAAGNATTRRITIHYSPPMVIHIGRANPAVGLDVPPVIRNGRLMVPFRWFGERLLGAQVDFLVGGGAELVTLRRDGISVELAINTAVATVNGRPILLDATAIIVGGRTLVPARFLAETFGFDVHWDSDTNAVTFTRR